MPRETEAKRCWRMAQMLRTVPGGIGEVIDYLEERSLVLRRARCTHPLRAIPSNQKDPGCSSAHCPTCDKALGEWYCPESPTGLCSYAKKDTCRDHCLHCGEPEERK